MKKERGKFLTVMLVIGAIGLLQTLFTAFNTSALTQVYETVPSWFSMYIMATAAVNLGAIVGIWMLKKWGVYLLFAQIGIGVLVQFFVLKPVQASQFGIFFVIASGALWFWAIYRKWKSFE